MPETTITFEAKAPSELLDRLRSQRAYRLLMNRIGAAMVADTQLNFRRQSAPDGTPWKPTHRGGQILSDTRRLRNSITYEATNDQVKIGTNVIYARTHQYGAVIRAKNAAYLRFVVAGKFVSKKEVTIPARPFLGVATRQVKKINRLIDDWLDELAD